ncbi:MAG: DUF2207 domain-containing protein [Flavobacteriales bacterium]|nr:DUF2207 domain-containing protein [Flavobacteriales bacterium]
MWGWRSKRWKGNFLALFTTFIVGLNAYGQTERITSFHTDLTVAPDGQLTVTEEINIHAAGVEFERGIVRRLLQRFNDHTGKQNRVRYAIDDVQQNGTTAPYHTETEGDDFVLYVGDKDTYLDTGDYRYRITYTTKDQVGFFQPTTRSLEREWQRLGLLHRQYLGGEPPAVRSPSEADRLLHGGDLQPGQCDLGLAECRSG